MRRGIVLAACLLGLCLAAPAAATERTVRPLAAGETLAAFDAAGSWQVALANTPDGGIRLLRSADGGRTFSELHRWANDYSTIMPGDASVGPDGTTWVSLRTASPEIDRVAADGSLVPWHSYSGAAMASLPLVFAGDTWVAVGRLGAAPDQAAVTLERYAPDGSLRTSTDLGQQSWDPGMRLAVDRAGLLLLDSGEAVRPGGSVSAYQPDLGRPDLVLYHGGLYTRTNSEVWLPTAEQPGYDGRQQLAVPVTGGTAIFDAVTDPYGGSPLPVVLFNPAPRGDSPGLPADTRRMLREANRLRAEQGLLPLVADAAISTASRNHAHYTDRWHEGHDETPRHAGFTGADATARCAAVGTDCGGEILFDGVPYEAAVRVWWATPFHRNVVGTPDSFVVGAASTRGTAVMDGGLRPLVVAPIGLPRGTWTGPRSFAAEIPDPGEPCGIHGPYGVAVTAHPFVDVATDSGYEPADVRLADAHGRTVHGCESPDGEYFLPAHELPRGTYHASATWRSDTGATLHRTWTFTATATDPTQVGGNGASPSSCLRIRARRSSARRIRLRVRACRSGRASIVVRRGHVTIVRRGVKLRARHTKRLTLRLHGRAAAGPLHLVVRGRGYAASVRLRRA